jgi:hypothetical protein
MDTNETLYDHLGNEIHVGAYIFWSSAPYNNRVQLNYGKITKISVTKIGNITVTTIRPGMYWNGNTHEQADLTKRCQRVDTITVIDPAKAVEIMEKTKDVYYG